MNAIDFYNYGLMTDESALIYKELTKNMQDKVWYYKTTDGKWHKKPTNNRGYTTFSFPYNAFKDEKIHPEIEELHFKDTSVSRFFVEKCPNLKLFRFHGINSLSYDMGLNNGLGSLTKVILPATFKNSLVSQNKIHKSDATSSYPNGLTLPLHFDLNNLIGI